MKLICLLVIASTAYAQNDGLVVKSTADAIRYLVPADTFRPAQREGKNLVGVFPFNQERSHHAQAHHDEHADHDEHRHDEHHGDHAVHAENLSAREARQRNRNRNRQTNRRQQGGGDSDHGSGAGAPTFDQVAAAGERCIDKIEMVEHTEYDEEKVCKHSYTEQCHQTYVTDYKPAQKQECEENFVKNCHIEYKKSAIQQKVRKCSTPQVCDGDGPLVNRPISKTLCETRHEVHEVKDDVVNCKTVYEQDCKDITQGYSTHQECKKWPRVECDKQNIAVKKITPISECRVETTQVSVPEGCILKAGEEICVDEVKTIINPKPVETCTLDARPECHHVTILVPSLKAHEECVDVPKEVCQRSRTNPHKVKRPVVKKWCYTPTAESGLGK